MAEFLDNPRKREKPVYFRGQIFDPTTASVEEKKLRQIYLKVKELRKYSHYFDAANNFDLNYIHKWTADQILDVDAQSEEFHRLTNRAHTIIKPRSQKRLESLQEYSGMNKFFDWKVAFVPSTGRDDEQIKITYDKKGNVKKVDVGRMTRQVIFTNPIDLINAETRNYLYEYLQNKLERHNIPLDNQSRFSFMCGLNEGNNFIASLDGLYMMMNDYINRYQLDDSVPDNRKLDKWFAGFVAYDLSSDDAVSQAIKEDEFSQYVKAKMDKVHKIREKKKRPNYIEQRMTIKRRQ